MNLLNLMQKIEAYNEVSNMLGRRDKAYVRFDGFERLYTQQEAVKYIERNYLNRTCILETEMTEGHISGIFTIADDGFSYEVAVYYNFM